MVEQETWKCSLCTLKNPKSKRRCNACRARKPIESSIDVERHSKIKKSKENASDTAKKNALKVIQQSPPPTKAMTPQTRKSTRKRKRPTSVQNQSLREDHATEIAPSAYGKTNGLKVEGTTGDQK